jgi:UDP-N-acetylmuramoyl-tripeptide--D-alanyl-D-alanine ligase
MGINELYSCYLQSEGVFTDTRKLIPGGMFFALKGINFNGNDYARAALASGAKYAVVDDPKAVLSSEYLLVDDVLVALQALARYHRRTFSIPVLAITGSNGKTTTKELCAAVLSCSYNVHYTLGNLNNHIGVPLTLLSTPKLCELIIVEMGANHQGEIAALCEIAEPTHGLITNIGTAHIEGFGGQLGVLKGKTEMYRYLAKMQGFIFLNEDSEYLTNNLPEEVKFKKYSVKKEYRVFDQEKLLSFEYKGKLVRTNLYGEYNLANVASAIAVSEVFKVEIDRALDAIECYVPENHRSQVIKIGNNTIVMDAYNSNPSSMATVLQSFAKSNLENKILIMGDMLELGQDAAFYHKEILDNLLGTDIQKVYLVGPIFMQFTLQYPGYHFFADVEQLKSEFAISEINNSSILLKGSRGIALEKLLN